MTFPLLLNVKNDAFRLMYYYLLLANYLEGFLRHTRRAKLFMYRKKIKIKRQRKLFASPVIRKYKKKVHPQKVKMLNQAKKKLLKFKYTIKKAQVKNMLTFVRKFLKTPNKLQGKFYFAFPGWFKFYKGKRSLEVLAYAKFWKKQLNLKYKYKKWKKFKML